MKISTLQDFRSAFAPRPDAAAKLTGNPGYLTDGFPPGVLHAAVLRSPLPHALVGAIDTAAAAAMPGVHAVITAADVPGRNLFGRMVADQPVLCGERVRYVGDALAAVAADTPEIAARAVAAMRVSLEPLPVVGDPETAADEGAAKLHPKGNLLHQVGYDRGDLEGTFARCVHIVEDTYRTGRQAHLAIETEGGFASPDGAGGLSIHAASHYARGDQIELGAILDIDPERIRVVPIPMGGSFGGKDSLHVQPIIALLALRTGRPVRLHYGRAESLQVGLKRHACRIRMRTGCDAEGRLLAQEVDLLADTGAYATAGPEVLETAHENTQGPYAFAAVRSRARLVYTNNGIAGSFRGFGAVQVQFAVEQQIDRLAALAGLDPAEMRARNLRRSVSSGPLDQITTGPQHPARVLEVLRRHPLWMDRAADRSDGRVRRGVGMALVTKGEGFAKGGPNQGAITMRLAADGVVELATGGVELGQGAYDAATRIASEALALPVEDIRIVFGDSALTPDSGPTAASRLTGFLYRGARLAAPLWREKAIAAAAAFTGLPAARLSLGPGGFWDGSGPPRNAPILALSALAETSGVDLGVTIDVPAVETPSAIGAHSDFTPCAALAEVAVDTWTGQVTAKRVVLFPACGPVVSPLAFVGQAEGGATMALGMALMEDAPADRGRYLVENLDTYFVPTIVDAPVVDVVAIEDLDAGDAIGPRGIGEISLNAVVPAIANALANAIGGPVRNLPASAAAVLATLEGS